MKKTAVIFMLLTATSHLLGFLKDLILAFFYGATPITDAYIISLTIPQIIFAFIGAGISTIFIPLYSRIEKEESIDSANQFTSKLINLMFILCTFIVIVTFTFTTPIVKLFAAGFNSTNIELTESLTKINIWGIYFSALVFLFSSFLQIKNRFSPTALMGIPLNIVIILSIYISTKYSILILAVGSTVGILVQSIFLLYFVIKEKFLYSAIVSINDKHIKAMFKLALPVMFGVSIYQINVLVDRTLASTIVEGGISALTYSSKVNALVFSLFAVPIATVFYPKFSKQISNNNFIGLKRSLNESINIINLMIIPSMIGIILYSQQIISLLFGRGKFDDEAIFMSSFALTYYSVGIIGVSIREILYRTYYAFQDTKTPLYNSAISLILNIILNFYLSKLMGLNGLALATSISAIFCTVLLIVNLRKKIGSFGLKKILISSLKILFSSIFMGLISKLSFNFFMLIFSQNVSLVLAIIIGAMFYFIFIYYMKIEEVDLIFSTVKKKLFTLFKS